MHRDCHPSTPKKSYLRGGRGGKRWKVLFCINELWTENMPKFESSQNHFVAKRFRVKKPSWNIYKSTPSDTRVLANIGTLFCAEEISSKKWSVLILRYETKRKFSKTCLFGQGAFFPENNWKNNETTKPPFPWIITSGRDYIIFPQKIRRLQEVLPQAQTTDNGREEGDVDTYV